MFRQIRAKGGWHPQVHRCDHNNSQLTATKRSHLQRPIFGLCSVWGCGNRASYFMRSDAVRAGARRFAADLEGPFGRRSLHWAAEHHLDYFSAARATGATWAQIAQALALAGAVADDGAAIKGSVLSATVSRIKRSRSTASDTGQDIAKSSVGKQSFVAAARQPDEITASSLTPPTRGASPQLPASPSKLATVRERMKRAAELRGKINS
jgi:hypothetical protein